MGASSRIPPLSLSSSEVEKSEDAGFWNHFPPRSIWQHPSVENILGYISNNLNQLAKSTKFLLLCLALKFLQTWLNRQERVIKLNLWNKNRPFGTSHTYTAGMPKSLSFFHVSNCVVLPPHACVSEQAWGSRSLSRHRMSLIEVCRTARAETLRVPSLCKTTPPWYNLSISIINFRHLRHHNWVLCATLTAGV